MTKVSELIGRKLDEWVARAEGYTLVPHRDTYSVHRSTADGDAELVGWIGDEYEPQFTPSTDPAQGQPIIERLKIGTDWHDVDRHMGYGWRVEAGWSARVALARDPARLDHQHCHDFSPRELLYGLAPSGVHTQGAAPPPRAETALIAAMRLRVMMVYGEEVPS